MKIRFGEAASPLYIYKHNMLQHRFFPKTHKDMKYGLEMRILGRTHGI